MAYAALIAVVVACLGYTYARDRLWHQKFELLCLRIQAPEIVVEQQAQQDVELPEAIDPESDEDYWEAQGVDPGEPITSG